MYCFQLYVLRKYVSGYQRHTNDSYLHVFLSMEIGESYIVGYFTLAFAFIQESMFMRFETYAERHTRQIILFFYLYSTIHT